MAKAARPIPEGLHNVTPHLAIKGAAEAIDFYRRAFGAEERFRSSSPDGKIMHADLKIGDSVVFLADEFPSSGLKAPKSLGGTAVLLNIYVADADALFARAVKAGAKPTMPPADMFWGDRYSQVEDPFGHAWAIATHKEDLTPEEMNKRATEHFSKMKP